MDEETAKIYVDLLSKQFRHFWIFSHEVGPKTFYILVYPNRTGGLKPVTLISEFAVEMFSKHPVFS